eukprot:Sdes_comp8874_c0_seq1m268
MKFEMDSTVWRKAIFIHVVILNSFLVTGSIVVDFRLNEMPLHSSLARRNTQPKFDHGNYAIFSTDYEPMDIPRDYLFDKDNEDIELNEGNIPAESSEIITEVSEIYSGSEDLNSSVPYSPNVKQYSYTAKI